MHTSNFNPACYFAPESDTHTFPTACIIFLDKFLQYYVLEYYDRVVGGISLLSLPKALHWMLFINFVGIVLEQMGHSNAGGCTLNRSSFSLKSAVTLLRLLFLVNVTMMFQSQEVRETNLKEWGGRGRPLWTGWEGTQWCAAMSPVGMNVSLGTPQQYCGVRKLKGWGDDPRTQRSILKLIGSVLVSTFLVFLTFKRESIQIHLCFERL